MTNILKYKSISEMNFGDDVFVPLMPLGDRVGVIVGFVLGGDDKVIFKSNSGREANLPWTFVEKL